MSRDHRSSDAQTPESTRQPPIVIDEATRASNEKARLEAEQKLQEMQKRMEQLAKIVVLQIDVECSKLLPCQGIIF